MIYVPPAMSTSTSDTMETAVSATSSMSTADAPITVDESATIPTSALQVSSSDEVSVVAGRSAGMGPSERPSPVPTIQLGGLEFDR